MNSTHSRCAQCQQMDNLQDIMQKLCAFYKNQIDSIEATRIREQEEYNKKRDEQQRMYNQVVEKYTSMKKMLDDFTARTS